MIAKIGFRLLFLLFPLAGFAQDIITLHDSTRIEAKVISITPEEVRYVEHSYPNGPTIVLHRSEVYKIKYPNGTERIIFRHKPVAQNPEAGYVHENSAQPAALLSVPAYQNRTPAERIQFYDAGTIEAKEFYKGSSTKLGVGVATFFGGGIGGLVVGGIAFISPPDIDLHPVSNPALRRDPDFRKGYEEEAHKKKRKKVASGFAIGLGTLIALVTILYL